MHGSYKTYKAQLSSNNNDKSLRVKKSQGALCLAACFHSQWPLCTVS